MPSGAISKENAIRFYLLLNLLGLFSAWLVSFTPFVIVVLTVFLLFLYSFKLKNIPFLGNVTVSFLTGFVFIYSAIVVGNPIGGVVPFLFAFEINLIRELIKDIEDIKGDKLNRLKTLPIIKGIDFTKKVISVLILLLIVSSPIPFVFAGYNRYFLFLIIIAIDIPLVAMLMELRNEEVEYSKISNRLKTLMIVGLGILIIGVV